MESRYLRKTLMFIAGIVEMAIAVFLLFYLDIAAKANVTWLFAITATGLAGGILLAFGANGIEDDESVISKWLALLGSVLSFLLILVMFGIKMDDVVQEKMLYDKSIEVVLYVSTALSVGSAIFSLVPTLWETE